MWVWRIVIMKTTVTRYFCVQKFDEFIMQIKWKYYIFISHNGGFW